MDLCHDHGKEAIAYQGINCPACEQIAELKQEIQEQKDALAALAVKIELLEERLDSK